MPDTTAFGPEKPPMLIKKPVTIKASEITPESVYRQRRRFLGAVGGGLLGLAGAPYSLALAGSAHGFGNSPLEFAKHSRFSTAEVLTPYEDVTRYNNFYEFGTDKHSPSSLARQLTVEPWSVAVGTTQTFNSALISW
jgi:sulfoxide reductase catalytic subunit YedY